MPNWESLTTRLIQKGYDLTLTNHLNRDGTIAILFYRYFWPGILAVIKRFVRNYDIYGRSAI
jgi:hypothetical protein